MGSLVRFPVLACVVLCGVAALSSATPLESAVSSQMSHGLGRRNKGMRASKPQQVTAEGASMQELDLGFSVPTVDLPQSNGGAVTFLLLHGARYNTATWQSINTLKTLNDAGHRVVAVDLPKARVTVNNNTIPTDLLKKSLVKSLVDSLQLTNVVLVSPSMSGTYATPYIDSKPAALAGWVPVAPVLPANWAGPGDLPTYAIYGENDAKMVDLSLYHTWFSGKEGLYTEFVVPDAPHACYLENADVFHEKLLEFAAKLSA